MLIHQLAVALASVLIRVGIEESRAGRHRKAGNVFPVRLIIETDGLHPLEARLTFLANRGHQPSVFDVAEVLAVPIAPVGEVTRPAIIARRRRRLSLSENALEP